MKMTEKLKKLIAFIIIFILLGTAFAPTMAFAAVESGLAKQVSKPWVESSTPWSPPSWGFFNTGSNSQTENASGSCLLKPEGVRDLRAVVNVVQKDYKAIQNVPTYGKTQKEKAFHDNVVLRIQTGDSIKAISDLHPSVADPQRKIGKAGKDGKNLKKWELINVREDIIKNAPNNKFMSPSDILIAISSTPSVSGCDTGGLGLKKLQEDMVPNPGDLFSQPAAFIIRLFLFVPFIIGYMIYNLIGVLSLQTSFTTPHSERGDTLVDTVNAQRNISKGGDAVTKVECRKSGLVVSSKPSSSSSANASNCKSQMIACTSNTKQSMSDQLGFNCKRASDVIKGKTETSFITMSKALRTLLSALYGVIVIVVALVYLFRQNSRSQYDVKIVLPKVLGAVVLSAAAPFIIGFLISMSNFIVAGSFSGTPTGSIPNQIDSVLLSLWTQSGSGSDGAISGIPGQLASAILPTLALIVLAFSMLFLTMFAVVKQLGLILLIIAIPIACLSFIMPKMNGLFGLWCRGLVAVITIPVIQAFILRTGLELSLALNKASGAIAALMATIILIVTFIAMLLVVLKFKTYLTGNNRHKTTGKLAGAALGATMVATGGTAAAAKVGLGAIGGRTRKGLTNARNAEGKDRKQIGTNSNARASVSNSREQYSQEQKQLDSSNSKWESTPGGGLLFGAGGQGASNVSVNGPATINSSAPVTALPAPPIHQDSEEAYEQDYSEQKRGGLRRGLSSFANHNAAASKSAWGWAKNTYGKYSQYGEEFEQHMAYRPSMIPQTNSANPFAAPNKSSYSGSFPTPFGRPGSRGSSSGSGGQQVSEPVIASVMRRSGIDPKKAHELQQVLHQEGLSVTSQRAKKSGSAPKPTPAPKQAKQGSRKKQQRPTSPKFDPKKAPPRPSRSETIDYSQPEHQSIPTDPAPQHDPKESRPDRA